MPEIVDQKQVYTLLEIAESLKQTISSQFASFYWIKAEMNKLNHYPQSGHCYPELIEKSGGKMVAQIRGTIWKDDYQRINKVFIETLQEPLKNGITILFLARPSFDPLYGLSLRINDIDPSFTLGELEKEKRASINQLIREGVFDLNKKLILPALPRRIAVISVETSKGYADFLKIINENPWQYRFFVMLFPALLQGDKAGASISFQLSRIERIKHHFDLVAIIRGGGGDAGLSAFNDADLARKIALFPLPVLTGIGHATNETVVEMVAYRNSITPTDLADFLILQLQKVSASLNEALQIIQGRSLQLLLQEQQNYKQLITGFKHSTTSHLEVSKKHLSQRILAVQGYSRFYVRNHTDQVNLTLDRFRTKCLEMVGFCHNQVQFTRQKVRDSVYRHLSSKTKELGNLSHQVNLLDPKNVLSRGYSMTLSRGKAIRSHTEIDPGEVIKTVIFDGEIYSTVTHTQKEHTP